MKYRGRDPEVLLLGGWGTGDRTQRAAPVGTEHRGRDPAAHLAAGGRRRRAELSWFEVRLEANIVPASFRSAKQTAELDCHLLTA